MSKKLTQEEKHFLSKGKHLLRFMSSVMSVATTPRSKIISMYQKFADLYERDGDAQSASECQAKAKFFENPRNYVSEVEEFLSQLSEGIRIPQNELVKVYYNLMEAYTELNESDKVATYKYKLDELLFDESEDNE